VGSLRVASLNAGSLIEPGWEERRHEVVAWIDRLDPDVVCLQETWQSPESPNSAEWVAEHCAADWHVVFGGLPFPSELWPDANLLFGSSVLSRWSIDHHELIPLPVDDQPASDKPAFRMNLELLHVRTNGIDVFSTHLAPPPEQAYHRITQVLAIDDAIRSRAVADSPLPPVLCGDFNAEPTSDEIRYLCGLATIERRSTYFQEAWTAAGNAGVGWTWDGRQNELAASMNLPPKRIDYVFVGDPFGREGGAGLVTACDLAFNEQLTGRHASDHFGLVVHIRLPDGP